MASGDVNQLTKLLLSSMPKFSMKGEFTSIPALTRKSTAIFDPVF